jgi:D-alanyl-D-alanine carboxypeptidase
MIPPAVEPAREEYNSGAPLQSLVVPRRTGFRGGFREIPQRDVGSLSLPAARTAGYRPVMGTLRTQGRSATERPRAAPRHRTRSAGLLVAVCLVTFGGALVGGRAVLGRAMQAGVVDGPLPACRIDDLGAPHATLAEWDRTVLDTIYGLARTYAPADLIPIGEAGIAGDGSVRAFVILDLEALDRAARRAGVRLAVNSAYRSYDAQARTFNSLVRAYGNDYALQSAARPGHSEHQLGTTIDFDGGEAWLADNAWRFGFVMSYPPVRSPEFTCYMPEPWHFRYLGRERAASIHAAGISPREWLWDHANDAT